MTTTPKPAPEKRIPVGTIVKFRARYSTDPLYTGEVLAFIALGSPLESFGWPAGADLYRVRVTHKDGKPVGTRGGKEKILTPYACRLEEQNADKLRERIDGRSQETEEA
jgi:hypothetical protein